MDRNVAEAIQKVARAGPCVVVLVVGGSCTVQGTSGFFGNVSPGEMGAMLGIAVNYLAGTVKLCREGIAPADLVAFDAEFDRALAAPVRLRAGRIVRRDTPSHGERRD